MNELEDAMARWSSMLRGIWRRRWLGLFVAWLAGLAGLAAVMLFPERYQATARIYINTQSILKPLMEGLAVQPNAEQQVFMLTRTLVSRPNAEKLVTMAQLATGDESPGQREALIARVSNTVQIRNAGGDNLYTLSWRDRDPDKAVRAVRSLVEILLQSSVSSRRDDSEAAKAFLDEQIASYRVKLEEAEARLKAFRLRNLDLQAQDGHDSAARLSELGRELSKVRLELREAENARNAAKAAMQRERVQVVVATPELDARIETQKRALDALLQRFTDRHPDVIHARRVLGELEDQRRSELAAMRSAASEHPNAGEQHNRSLAYQEMSKVLAVSEVQVAALRARVAEYAARHEKARTQSKAFPQLEAELAQLNRDYAVHTKNYEDLVARRESAGMSSKLEAAAGTAEFRVIDPPSVDPQPVRPSRMTLLPVALAAALAAGVAAASLASRIRPVVHRARDIHAHLNVPLLGVISQVSTPWDRTWHRTALTLFWLTTLVLLLAYAGTFAEMRAPGTIRSALP